MVEWVASVMDNKIVRRFIDIYVEDFIFLYGLIFLKTMCHPGEEASQTTSSNSRISPYC